MPRQFIPVRNSKEEAPPISFRVGEVLLSTESVKDVLDGVCGQVAVELAKHGFRYLASKRLYRAEKNGLTYEVSFQSSQWNRAGRHVDMRMYAIVRSAELKAIRQSKQPQEFARDDAAGGLAHNLADEYADVSWEFADPATRQDTVNDLIDFIRTVVLPYFARFEDRAALVAQLVSTGLPGFIFPRDEVELAYCFGGQAAAQAVLDRFLRARPDLHEAVAAEAASPSPTCLESPNGYAEQVVYLRHHYALS